MKAAKRSAGPLAVEAALLLLLLLAVPPPLNCRAPSRLKMRSRTSSRVPLCREGASPPLLLLLLLLLLRMRVSCTVACTLKRQPLLLPLLLLLPCSGLLLRPLLRPERAMCTVMQAGSPAVGRRGVSSRESRGSTASGEGLR